MNLPKSGKRGNVRIKATFACVCVGLLLLMTAQVGVSQQAEQPTWEVGDSWSLGKSDIDLSSTSSFMGITFDTTGDGSYYVVYEVVKAGGEEYTVDLTGGMKIDMDVELGGLGSMDMSMVGKVDGTLYYTKDNLALDRADETIDLDMKFSGNITAMGKAKSFSGSMNATSNMNITYDPPIDIFDFPIKVGENWTAESTATVKGSISGTMKMKGKENSISKSFKNTVDISLEFNCPGTEDIPLASTCYKIVWSGTGMSQASPFMPAATLYYSPDRGFIVKSETNLGKAMSNATLGLEKNVSYLGGTTRGEQTITLNPVTEQEAKNEIAGMSLEEGGISMTLIGAIIAVVVIVLIALIALRRRRSAAHAW